MIFLKKVMVYIMHKNENYLHILKFVLFSISAGIIQGVSFTLLNELVFTIYWPSYLIALTLSVIWNFTLNRKFTFKSSANIFKSMSLIILYYVFFTPVSTYLGNYYEAKGHNEYLILFITMISNLITEFVFTKYVVYHKHINTAKKLKRT